MNAETASLREMKDEFDVLIVGAGISGIDAAYHLQTLCPGKSFALLEKQESYGGTWHTHRFPGVRSDSDPFTFGYRWKPWSGPVIATAEDILKYLDEVLDEQDLRQHIRYRHEVMAASWCSEKQRWTLTVARGDTGERFALTCKFLWMCQGYYHHDKGYTPEFPGREQFRGPVVHPQSWPDDLDCAGKKVIVIGSGATAATLIPALAENSAHVTMLQRSPTYYYARPTNHEIVDLLRRLDIPDEWTHEIMRRLMLNDQQVVTRRSFEDPENLKNELIGGVRAYLGKTFDVKTHFTPRYRPWRQRLAVVPDGDLFKAIRAGTVSVVTDHIDCFTEDGILLRSGKELDADIIVTATGLNLCALGDIAFAIDDTPLNFADCWGYYGILFTGVPNMAWIFGYLRTGWTMRADMVADFVCRLLNHMAEKGVETVVPQLREEDCEMAPRPFIEAENFNPGYVTRSVHVMPKQGDRAPWIFSQDYYAEKNQIPATDLDDGTLVYR